MSAEDRMAWEMRGATLYPPHLDVPHVYVPVREDDRMLSGLEGGSPIAVRQDRGGLTCKGQNIPSNDNYRRRTTCRVQHLCAAGPVRDSETA